jgi:hypothetical protein
MNQQQFALEMADSSPMAPTQYLFHSIRPLLLICEICEICGSTFLFTFLGSNKKAGCPAFAKHPAIF